MRTSDKWVQRQASDTTVHSTPLFSVVIPLYNRREAIVRAIESVQRQTFQDFEIVVVDDGSSDSPEEVITGLDDSRVRLIRQDNAGAAAARNTGIDEARGNYIAFLDSDDTFLPHHLESALAYLTPNPTACTYTQVVVERGNGVRYLKPRRGPLPNEHISDYLLRSKGFVPTITLVVPRDLARSVRYDPAVRYGQDTDFALRLVSAGAQLKMLDRPSAVWADLDVAGRVSANIRPEERLAWLARVMPLITRRAYWSHKGRTVAKAFARQGQWAQALKLYALALANGAYRPRVAVITLLQILLSPKWYRRMADRIASWGIAP